MSKNVTSKSEPAFVPTAEAKKQAGKFRMLGVLFWVLAIAAQIGAIMVLLKGANADDPWPGPDGTMFWVLIIGLMAVDLILVIVGSSFWKKSNRLDPASEKNKLRFLIQNQLGVVAAIVAFLPLVLFILMNKDLEGKHKTILTAIASAFLAAAVIPSIDFDPPSQESYAAQSFEVQMLMDKDEVYWAKASKKFHLDKECGAIKNSKEVFDGTVQKAHEDYNIKDLCSHCRNKAMKAKNITEDQIQAEKTARGLLDAPQEVPQDEE